MSSFFNLIMHHYSIYSLFLLFFIKYMDLENILQKLLAVKGNKPVNHVKLMENEISFVV